MESNLSSALIMALLVALSAYFSATETAFSSLNRTRLKSMAEKGSRRARLTLQLVDEYDKLLSAILVGNNIVNIATSSIGTILFIRLYGDIGATISTVVVTVVVLIFGEISPKSLAKENPERFAMFAAPVIGVITWLLTPVNFLFARWKKLLSRLFRVKDDRRMTQDELLMIVSEAQAEGGIDRDEGVLIRRAIEFTDRSARDILTHRVHLDGVSLTADKDTVAARFASTRYSRLLVFEGSIDNIVGILHLKDFYSEMGASDRPLSELMTEPLFVSKNVPISELLKQLQKSQSHIAVVTDGLGGTLGIVTMEDILEELVGEILDEHDAYRQNRTRH